MGLTTYQTKVLYEPPASQGEVEFQEKNFGMPVSEVTQEEFLERVFGDYEGHLCVFQKESNGSTGNSFYKNKEKEALHKFLKETFEIDTYLSYSTYFRNIKKNNNEKLRTQTNIVHTYMLVQDLDYYKDGLSAATVLNRLGEMVKNGELICPSFLISTGRGYQLVWLLEPFKNIKGYTYDKDWLSIQNHLFDKLKEFKTDSVVKNPSAVTRLVGTKHRSSGKKVYGFLANEQVSNLKDFLFFHNIVPTADRKVRVPQKKIAQTKQVTRLVSTWNEYTLNKQRAEDIFTYVRVQNERNVSYIGIRNWLALVLRFHTLVYSDGDKKLAAQRVRDLCLDMVMEETSEDDILRRSNLAEQYYDEWVNDTWNREKYVRGGLFYTNRRMLELMDVKEDYYMQWKLKTIKIKDNKYEAKRKHFERLEKGQIHSNMNEYNKVRKIKKYDKIQMLEETIESSPDATNKELAYKLALSVPYIKKLKQELKNGKK